MILLASKIFWVISLWLHVRTSTGLVAILMIFDCSMKYFHFYQLYLHHRWRARYRWFTGRGKLGPWKATDSSSSLHYILFCSFHSYSYCGVCSDRLLSNCFSIYEVIVNQKKFQWRMKLHLLWVGQLLSLHSFCKFTSLFELWVFSHQRLLDIRQKTIVELNL